MRAKRLPTILERVKHCSFCGRSVEDSVLGHRENPFCPECLPERMADARRKLGRIGWKVDGDYIEFFTEDSRTPA
jgi:hypothetical protein